MSRLQRLVSAAKPYVQRVPWLAGGYVGARGYYRVLRKLREEEQELPAAMTPQGFTFAGAASGHAAMADGTWEAAESALFLDLIRDADLVINVGANVGYYCCLALQAGKPLWAFEPLPSNLKYLYRNVHANGWGEQAEVYPVALGGRNGLLELYGTGMGASLIKGWAGYAPIAPAIVPVFTYDTLIGARAAGRRCVVLVDVEGAEYDLLQGAGQLLHQEPRPLWLMEIHSRHSQPAGVEVNPRLLATFRVMWDAGYRAYFAEAGYAARPPLDEAAVLANAAADLAVQKYDFLFV
jgi:FkbM family methyltransferase